MQGGVIDRLDSFLSQSFSLSYMLGTRFIKHSAIISYVFFATCAIYLCIFMNCTIKRIVIFNTKCFICENVSRPLLLFQCDACAAPVWPGFARSRGGGVAALRLAEAGGGTPPRAPPTNRGGHWHSRPTVRPPHFYTVAKFTRRKERHKERSRRCKLCNANVDAQRSVQGQGRNAIRMWKVSHINSKQWSDFHSDLIMTVKTRCESLSATCDATVLIISEDWNYFEILTQELGFLLKNRSESKW